MREQRALDDVENFREARPEVQVFVYEDADHGFNCDHHSQYNEATAKLALSRTRPFVDENLT